MDISGIWYNELGSQLVLQVNGDHLIGSYQTKVGDANGIYPLIGQYNNNEMEIGQVLAFVVLWKNSERNSNSVTSWSGQAQVINEQEVISTTWLLTSETEPDQDWHSTLVGKDIFTRNYPDDDKIRNSCATFPFKK